jgi:hypothetical protein
MENLTGANDLVFTQLDERYRGYRIEWATITSQNQPTKWLGHFHAIKEGEHTIRGSLVNPQHSAADALERIILVVKQRIDEAVL